MFTSIANKIIAITAYLLTVQGEHAKAGNYIRVAILLVQML